MDHRAVRGRAADGRARPHGAARAGEGERPRRRRARRALSRAASDRSARNDGNGEAGNLDSQQTLTGQHAFITGGGSGIGAAVAVRLAAAGARVTIAGRRREPLEHVVATLGAGHGSACADVADESQVQRAIAAAGAERGPVTILVNGAGLAQSAPATRTTLALWNDALAVNLTGAFLCSREFLLQLPAERPGRIVNIASTAGLHGYGYVSAYCAAKHGLIGYTRALAVELARRPVTVNAVCPGYTETPLLEEAIANIVRTTGRTAAEVRAELARSNPQGRFVQPAEVAAAVYWLCLPEAAAITGTAIPVAGGEIQ
ncbi:MAG: SDR family NAD(P)-dependent oxidoreductase [Steroidobacteraceae bacterium]